MTEPTYTDLLLDRNHWKTQAWVQETESTRLRAALNEALSHLEPLSTANPYEARRVIRRALGTWHEAPSESHTQAFYYEPDRVYQAILREVEYAHAKHGNDYHTPLEWLRIAVSKLSQGESRWYEFGDDAAMLGMLSAAAVAVCAMEQHEPVSREEGR